MLGRIIKIDWNKRLILAKVDSGEFLLFGAAWKHKFSEGEDIEFDAEEPGFLQISNLGNSETMLVLVKKRFVSEEQALAQFNQ
jgi:hypothetical protein